MATAFPTRLSRSESRKFGLQVGAAFVLLGGILFWRGRAAAPWIALLGAALVAAGVVVPTALRPVHRLWMAGSAQLSRITTPIVLGIIYFIVITPFGSVLRLLGKNPLNRVAKDGTYWVTRVPGDSDRVRMERQF